MGRARRKASVAQWLRGKVLIAAATALYLITLGGTFYTLDIAYYQQEKWTIIAAKATSPGYMDREAARLLALSFSGWVDRPAHQAPSARSVSRQLSDTPNNWPSCPRR
jgi:hypothetical protein